MGQSGVTQNRLVETASLPHCTRLSKITASQVKQEWSFLKKRTKRLLLPRRAQDRGHGRYRDAGAETKVFCFFSSEKKDFLFSPQGESRRGRLP